MASQFQQLITNARDAIQSQRLLQPKVACILGSGLGGLADQVSHAHTIDYATIPGFTKPHAAGHAGRLILGYVSGVPAVLMQGRSHRYEGHSHWQLQFPVHVMHALGARILVATNAAGGLNSRYAVNDLMVIDSHIDMLWRSRAGRCATRPDERTLPIGNQVMRGRHPYSYPLIHRAKEIARNNNIVLHQGCYLATLGPTYETRHEYRMFRWMGADAVGMSTIPEVLAAQTLGMEALAFSVITNVASTDLPSLTSHEEVVHAGKQAGPKLQRIIERILSEISGQPD